MRCSACKTQNREGSLLCERCGRSLTADTSSLGNTPVSAPVTRQNAVAAPEMVGHSSISVTPVADSSAATPSLSNSSNLPPAAALPSTLAGAAMDTRQFTDGEAYQPSGRSTPGAGLKLFGTAIVAGVLVGALYHFVSHFIDLVLFFPLIAGAIAGTGLGKIVQSSKVRSPRLAMVNGIICGLLVVATMQVLGAISFRSEVLDYLPGTLVPASVQGKNGKPRLLSPSETAKAQSQIRTELESDLTPMNTLVFYEKSRGAQGSTLQSTHSGSGQGIKLSGGGFWALEGLEALLLVGACAGAAGAVAKKPFCENCDVWHKTTNILRVHPSQNALLWPQIAAQNWQGLLATPIGKAMDNKHQTMLSVTSCPSCNHGTITATSVGGKVPKEFACRRLNPEATRALLQTRATPVA